MKDQEGILKGTRALACASLNLIDNPLAVIHVSCVGLNLLTLCHLLNHVDHAEIQREASD